uniref:Uncharacterized protein n=1 Tax=Pipistrellus kuhlii TaxID=59472 RepID=A0A7J7XB63_PIPKU|nr:hypothetical protein mPipKuh1_010629 [Pipistrellus kuhlii]
MSWKSAQGPEGASESPGLRHHPYIKRTTRERTAGAGRPIGPHRAFTDSNTNSHIKLEFGSSFLDSSLSPTQERSISFPCLRDSFLSSDKKDLGPSRIVVTDIKMLSGTARRSQLECSHSPPPPPLLTD